MKMLVVYVLELVGPLAPLGVPCWKPFLNFLETSLRVLMRPVPVVFLLLAFSPQLSVIVQLVLMSGLFIRVRRVVSHVSDRRRSIDQDDSLLVR